MVDCIAQLQLVGIGHLKEFLNTLVYSKYNKVPQLQKLNKFDRNGKVISALKSSLNNHVYYNMYFNENCLFQTECYQDEEAKLFIPKKNLSDTFNFLYLEGNDMVSPLKRIEFTSRSLTECTDKFREMYLKLTGKEFNQSNSFDPDGDLFGTLTPDTPPKNRIPSLQRMLLGVLRQKMLICPKDIDTYLEALPERLLEDFITECLNDSTPNGFDALQAILRKIKPEEKEFLRLPTPSQLLRSALDHDHWFSFSNEKGIAQNIFVPPYNNNFKINVYDNYSMFIIKQWSNQNEYVYKAEQSLLFGSPSIVKRDQFNENMKLMTLGTITDTFNWDNTLLVGSILTSCLTGDIERYQESDINIYFHGLDRLEISNRIMEYISHLPRVPTIIHSFKGVISVACHYPYRTISFHLEPYLNIEHLLVTNDINCSSFGYDGQEVYCLYRSMESLNYRSNFVNNQTWTLHGDIHYQHRLVKYSERGFSIISEDYNFFVNNKDFVPHFSHNGLAMLVSSFTNVEVYKFLQQPFSIIPYGVSWNKASVEKKLSSDNKFTILSPDKIPSICTESELKRKFSSMSSNMSPFINIEPRPEVDLL
ncbi:hypothetical protein SAMD00019534_038960 [Acytostelium subglobosum LB1]|uniref:hypothetical protein n=1 Tax=Acytostelium subglobosum LB1 TaxID=1410327 RepID=UPI00064485B8|nr:hypothetical protein SAMD00019534_038960 [Acytostelium subglobosum LB1]GAM20721.1 hypothetical protein SAMD00019534_038960 [Acytostelium subglobosum LB1]|eukprot:XP_012755855.1 hypothetical protein SAMD00019534_038960 [Acytostelium subglobosum LB1]